MDGWPRPIRRLLALIFLWGSLWAGVTWWVVARAERPFAESWDVGVFLATIMFAIILALLVSARRRRRAPQD